MAKKKHNSKRGKSLGKRLSRGVNALTEWIESFFKSISRVFGRAFHFVSALLIPKSLTKRVDRATKSTGKSVGKKVGAVTEHVEKKFSKGASGVLTYLGLVLKIFLPKPLLEWFSKVSKAISRRISRLFRSISKLLGSLAERYLPKWLVMAYKRASKRMRRARRVTSKFTTAWWKSRDFNALAWSTPAFLLAIPMMAGIVLAGAYSPSSKIARYNRAMFAALEDEEFEKADLFRRKLSQLGYRQMESVEFDNAFAIAKQGDMAGAYERMLAIAILPGTDPPSQLEASDVASSDTEIQSEGSPEVEKKSFAPAHLWIAGALLGGDEEFLQAIEVGDEAETLRLAKAHADAALLLEKKNIYGRYLVVRYFVRIGQIHLASEYLKEIVGDYPNLNGELMQYYVVAGEALRARNCAKRYAKVCASQYAEFLVDPSSDDGPTAADCVNWAEALALTGEVKESARVARLAGRRFPNDPKVRGLASTAVFAELGVVDQQSPEALQLLREAHELDPTNEKVIKDLANRMVYQQLQVQSLLDEMKQANTVSAQVYVRAGELYVRGGRHQEGMECFEQAIEIDAACSQAYNNLAWLMANVAPKRLQAALDAVNKAIEINAHADFFETRGQIHFQRDELELAASDLERALNGSLPRLDQLNSHQTLAKIYTRLGNTERADAHEMRAKIIKLPRS